MALSKRNKDILLDVKDEVAHQAMNDNGWPDALPNAMNGIVVAYLLTPTIAEVRELDEHFKRLKNETMAPFRNAINLNVMPLLNNPVLAEIYQNKPKKTKSTHFVTLFDNIIAEIAHVPESDLLEFLSAVFKNDWDREEKNHFKQAKENIKKLYEIANIKQLNQHVAQIIFEKLNHFISHTITYAFEDSKVGVVKNSRQKKQVVKVGERVEQLFQQEQSLEARAETRMQKSFIFAMLMGLAGGVFGAVGLEISNKPCFYLGIALSGTSFCLLMLYAAYQCSTARHNRQANFLQRARNRFFQPVGEAKADDLESRLLSIEEQAEYKDDESQDARPGSP